MRLLLFIFFLTCFFQSSALDYYWVGGSGNWSDISHWAAASGGTVKYPTAPTSEDNVIFDDNSFTGPNQTITFVNNIIFCKSMDWSSVTNNPILAGPSSAILSVFGDLTLSPNMQLMFEGEFLLTGVPEDKTVDFAGHLIPGVVTFDGDSNWGINSMTNIDTILEIRRGNVNFNGMPINCKYLHINTSGVKSVDISNSNIIISGTYQDEFGYDGNGSVSFILDNTNLTLEATGSNIQLTAENADFYHIGGNLIELNDLAFTAATGAAFMSSEWYDVPLAFRDISFASSAIIEGPIQAVNINLAGGGRYSFGAEHMYEFGNINTMGDCAEGVVIISDNPGFASIFTITAPTLDLSYVTLRDIHGQGGSTLNANNGVDLGNNIGWIFTNNTPVDYFWIGGNGMWDDPQHWSLTSGGVPSGCVPSGKDNAYFDINSFSAPNQSVTLSSRRTFIHDMIWNGVTGSPEFTGNPLQNLVLTGSLELALGMEHDIMGIYNFESPELGNTILMNGNIFNENIIFSGADADWTFLDDVEVYRTLYFRSGLLNTNGNQLILTRFNSNYELPRELNIENSNIILRESLYQGPEWRVDLENYTVQADNSNITFNNNGVFNHEGAGSTYVPEYNELIFNTLRGNVFSLNANTPEEVANISINQLSFNGQGSFNGSSQIGTLMLSEGFAYTFDSGYGRTQYIDEVITQGTCEAGLTQLFGSSPGDMGNILFSQDHTLERMYIKDIDLLSNNLTSNQSINGGNNQNITFTALIARKLYWVENAGVWQDPAHWSLTSGGPGGECIPTAIDTVIFDDLSFDMDNQEVMGMDAQSAFCSNVYGLNLFGNPRISLDFLLVNGSVEFDLSFRNEIYEFIFISENDEDIITGGQDMNNLRFRNSATYTFRDDHLFNNYNHESGNVAYENVTAVGNAMQFHFDNAKELSLGNSEIILFDNGDYAFFDRGSNLVVSGDNYEINFTGEGSGVFSRSNLELNKVIFSNTQGIGGIGSRVRWQTEDYAGTINISSITFNGNGEVLGNLTADTIIGVSGKVYILDNDREVSISEYLQLRGNNCTPIELRSSVNAINARISMPSSAEIVMDFVQMKDITGLGGAMFNAGSRSVDVGNSNIGWTFSDPPDFIDSGFLGLDRTICQDEPVDLVAFSYSPNEEYLWSDGSTDSIFSTTEAGTYFVEVQFESDCILRDTVIISDAEMFEANLPESINICNDGFIQLNASVDLEEAMYLWGDGSTEPMIEVTEAGKYIVEIEALGCVTEDSTIVEIIQDPGDFLPADTTFCDGQVLQVSPTLVGDAYLWKDNSIEESFQAIAGDTIWLELEIDGCDFRDSIILTSIALPFLDLGQDTSICDNSFFTFSLPDNINYLWNDGSNSSEYEVNFSGQYSVQAEDSGCVTYDSISVTMIPAPIVELGNDISSCISEEVYLSVPDPNVTFEWEDGSTDMDRLVERSGEYWLEVEENGCLGRDTITVELLNLPEIDLGLDTIVCEREEFHVIPLSVSNGDITWQNGSSDESFRVLAPGLITATIFDGVCSNVDSIMVDFMDCTFFDMYIPNVFSPNDDGYNDFFEVHFSENLIIESFSMRIFDRWGNKVFSSASVDETWDGKLNTEALGSGVYIYFIDLSYIDQNGPGTEFISGDIGVVR